MGADPAFVPTASSPSVSTKGFNPGDVWLTDEQPPRRLIIKGTAAVDPDVLVAYFEDGSVGHRGKTFWIVKSSGFVCGIHPTNIPAPKVYAKFAGDNQ